ncbi:porphobilinogen deaminase, dipyromethane cofactor binding domain-containing protein [Scenedesmus sp. NREL 46B-D3]|nr:porphobilinogen deaminase, dipyromethane cofactor binding domain-containing protein [Scenedesmus sp. NREL 46B-D3]
MAISGAMLPQRSVSCRANVRTSRKPYVPIFAAASAHSIAQIRIGTRASKLAKLQAQQVQGLLRRVRPEWTDGQFEMLEYTTHGDKEKTEQLRTLGQGAFTEVIDQAVADGSVDIGVHSLKDQPVLLPAGVQLAACLPRDDPRDAFISSKYACTADLPAGARVGTSSLRRKAQLLHAHPHLKVVPVRGNIDARLQMLQDGELDAIVLAAAALSRLGQSGLVTRVLGLDEMLPAACQGAIGISCRAQDPFLRWELGLICHEPTWLEVAAERAVLKHLLLPEEEQPPQGDQQSSPHSSKESGQPSQASIPLSSSSSSSRGMPSSAPPYKASAASPACRCCHALRLRAMLRLTRMLDCCALKGWWPLKMAG